MKTSAPSKKRKATYTTDLSVVVPVKNRFDLLEQLLKTLLSQLDHSVELILVLDHDSAPLPLRLSHLLHAKKNVRIYVSKKNGAGSLRNEGARIAAKTFIWFVDSDDLVADSAVATILQAVNQHQADVFIFGAASFDHPNGGTFVPTWFLNTDGLEIEKPYSPRALAKDLFQRTSPAAWNLVIRRQFLISKDIFFSNTKSSNDLAFTYTAMAIATRLIFYNEIIYVYRRSSPNSVQSENVGLDLPFAFRALRRELKRRGVFSLFEDTYFQRYRQTLLGWWRRRQKFGRTKILIVSPSSICGIVRSIK